MSASTGLAFTSAAATGKGPAGTVHAATLVPTLALYFRPFAPNICPGAVAGAYLCDFRIATTSGAAGAVSTLTLPNNLLSVYGKVWGAGGGGYDAGSHQSAGGSGGFSQGRISSINSVPLHEINSNGTDRLRIYVGGFGAGSTDIKNGGGGGAGSGIFGYFSSTNRTGIISGGGGGASYSNANPTTGADCNAGSVDGTTSQCGLGGNGAGLTTTTVDAPDAVSQCGGRGGDNVAIGSGPPTSGGGTGDCDDGGAPNSSGNGGAAGASGGAAGSDGSTNLLAGGLGADADETDGANGRNTNSNAAGGGGGGGGSVGGEAGGYDHASARTGYGGGGGSAARDSSGVANATGMAGSYVAPFSDTATGDVAAVNGAHTPVTSISKNILSAGWTVGMNISGTGIAAGATIFSIDSSTSLTVTAGQGNGTHNGTNLSVTGTTTALTSTPGGSTDFYYFPSYLSSSTYGRPGVGGYNSANINGTAGAVVLIW